MTDAQRLESILAEIESSFPSVEVLKTGARRERGAYALNVTIDREGGVDTALCEQVTRFIDKRVERLVPPVDAYTIEVGSAGVDRPLLVPAHYIRFLGREARIITRLRIQNRVEFSGPIEAADEAKVRVADRYAGSVDIPYPAIKKANLVYRVQEDLKRSRPHS